MKEFRNPQDIHRPVGSYSHQIEIRGNERLLVLSGQVGMREDGTVPDDPLEQIEVAFENIFRNLRAAGMEQAPDSARSGRMTAPTASGDRRSSSPTASMISPTTSSIWSSRGYRAHRRAPRASRASSSRSTS